MKYVYNKVINILLQLHENNPKPTMRSQHQTRFDSFHK